MKMSSKQALQLTAILGDTLKYDADMGGLKTTARKEFFAEIINQQNKDLVSLDGGDRDDGDLPIPLVPEKK